MEITIKNLVKNIYINNDNDVKDMEEKVVSSLLNAVNTVQSIDENKEQFKFRKRNDEDEKKLKEERRFSEIQVKMEQMKQIEKSNNEMLKVFTSRLQKNQEILNEILQL